MHSPLQPLRSNLQVGRKAGVALGAQLLRRLGKAARCLRRPLIGCDIRHVSLQAVSRQTSRAARRSGNARQRRCSGGGGGKPDGSPLASGSLPVDLHTSKPSSTACAVSSSARSRAPSLPLPWPSAASTLAHRRRTRRRWLQSAARSCASAQLPVASMFWGSYSIRQSDLAIAGAGWRAELSKGFFAWGCWCVLQLWWPAQFCAEVNKSLQPTSGRGDLPPFREHTARPLQSSCATSCCLM